MDIVQQAFKKVAWISPIASCQQAIRFELPMDLKTLEGMTPVDYLNKHCLVSGWMKGHCMTVFKNLDHNNRYLLPMQKVEEGISKVHWTFITKEQITTVTNLMRFPDDFEMDLTLFTALCCVADRVLKLHHRYTERKDTIEAVDFGSLVWKLKDYNIPDSLQELLVQLQL